MTRLLAVCAALALCAPASSEEPMVVGPPAFAACAVYYHRFGGPKPDLCADGITQADLQPTDLQAGGPLARCFAPGSGAAPLRLHGPALSPHRPLTVSFWWALARDLPVDGAFGLFQLTGRGYVSAFCRGKGEWCALQRPAGVLQVWNLPGVQNVNGIYDFDLAAHLDLRGGAWHHTAVVFRRASAVQLYTDGRLATEVTLSGREFAAQDRLEALDVGAPGVRLAEVLVLSRAVDGDMLADYYRGVRRLAEYRAVEAGVGGRRALIDERRAP